MFFRASLLALILLSGEISVSFAAERPNLLVILADDCTYNDLPMYGGENARTPHLTQLAKEGLCFEQAYLASAMCQPCRAELYTGLYPMRNGCAWNHSASRPNTRSMPHYLGDLGYRVGLAGKVHVKPAPCFPFEKIEGFDPSCVRDPTRQHQLEPVREFMTRDSRQPFCLVVALVEPHVPWVMGDASQYPPQSIKLPPNIANTPLTRRDFGRYLAEITYMDGQVGELLELLKETGQESETLVLFSSEQGSQFPGCKWTNWNTGLHTALIARWPQRIAPHARTSALVQYADVLPTFLELAGGTIEPGQFDGESFAAVLLGEASEHRDFVYGMHNNLPEGPAYPIRSISDGKYRWIENLEPDRLYIEKHLMGISGKGKLNNQYWATWIWASTENEATYRLVHRYMRRPSRQLYHTTIDPYELNNIAGDPSQAGRIATMRAALQAWMEQQGDPGSENDTRKALQAARQGAHLYGPPQ